MNQSLIACKRSSRPHGVSGKLLLFSVVGVLAEKFGKKIKKNNTFGKNHYLLCLEMP